ncbi:MAG: molybdopterin binding domain protein [Alphaproteobacteria bacterium]|jgi:molybdenum cofactor synthesis domain-containing protein|nr:molybdopterin binding domain protein [Alphaproteobacteria bacterium]MDF3034499.1 molybdopterin binding domain protein [Alphaproteobacteria bacterium]
MVPTAAILIIGNEILSGRTQDVNIQYLAKRLGELGIRLDQARVIPDEVPSIVATVRELAAHHTYVFTTGGIGFTHDDRTAAALAEAFDVPLEEHPEALRLLQTYYGDALNAARRRMALVPVGAVLVDNPISKAPGFQIQNVFVLAGVPDVMQAMFESLRGRLSGGAPIQFTTVSCGLPEGILADDLAFLQGRYPEVEIGSYPSFRLGVLGVSLVMRGIDAAAIASATEAVVAMVKRLGGEPAVE